MTARVLTSTGQRASGRRLLPVARLLPGEFRSDDGRLPRPLLVLAVMALVDATGTGLFLAASIAVFTRMIGVSGEQVGVALTVSGLVSLVAAVPTGVLIDRYGPRRVLVGVCLWRACGLVAYVWCHDFTQFFATTCVLALADRAAPPVTQALVSELFGPRDRVPVMAAVRSVRNVGFTLGAMLSAVALALDSRTGYSGVLVGDALSFVLMVLAVGALRPPAPTAAGDVGGGGADGGDGADGGGADGGDGADGVAEPATETAGRAADGVAEPGGRAAAGGRSGARLVLTDRPFLRVTWVNAVLSLHMTLLAVAIPTWVLEHTDVPRVVLAALLAVNTVLAVALQVPASRGTDSVRGASRALVRAGTALALCCALLAVTPDLPVALAVGSLVVAVVALTGAELWQSAGGWGLSYALAPPAHQGVYLSTFNLGVTAQQVLGPGLLAVVVIPAGRWGWLALAVVLTVLGWTGRRLLAPSAAATPSAVATPSDGREEGA